jgi:hypothetical protein
MPYYGLAIRAQAVVIRALYTPLKVIICHEARSGGSINVVVLTRYTIGYYTEVQEVRRH